MSEWIVLSIAVSAFLAAMLLFYISHLIRDMNHRQVIILKQKSECMNLTQEILKEIQQNRDDQMKYIFDIHRGERK